MPIVTREDEEHDWRREVLVALDDIAHLLQDIRLGLRSVEQSIDGLV